MLESKWPGSPEGEQAISLHFVCDVPGLTQPRVNIRTMSLNTTKMIILQISKTEV